MRSPTTLTPEDLVDQAARLAAAVATDRPTQADLRRAISATYYAVFHAVLIAAADAFVGAAERDKPAYGLVYRSIDHRQVRDLCDEIGKRTPSLRLAVAWPSAGFSASLKTFAAILRELQAARHDADYNPLPVYAVPDVSVTIEAGRRALDLFASLHPDERRVFVTLLAFKARSP